MVDVGDAQEALGQKLLGPEVRRDPGGDSASGGDLGTDGESMDVRCVVRELWCYGSAGAGCVVRDGDPPVQRVPCGDA